MVPQVLSTCLRHSPTDDSSSSYRRIRTPGQSGQMPCPCLGATGGASCTRSRHSRWSLKYCRRSLSHQEWRWFWSLNCNWQRRGFQSRWISPKKIRSRCMSRVKTHWHKTFGWVTETRHFRPSNLHGWKLCGPSWGRGAIPGKLPTWCQGAFGNLHGKCTNPTGQDSWRSVGRKDGTCFESEVISSAPTWWTSSGTASPHRRYYHFARLWLQCYVIGCTIRRPTRTSSCWSELFGWNVRCNAESCLSGTFI